MDMEKRPSPVRIIRRKCLDCQGRSTAGVRDCPSKECPLWPYRFGADPFRKRRKMGPYQKQQLQEGYRKALGEKCTEPLQ